MRRYDLYKDSGINWVHEIPLNWEIDSIGKVMVERSVKVSDTEYPPLSVTKNGIVPQLEGVAKTDNNDNRKLVCSGDFVINSRSDRKGSSGYSNLTGSVSVINIVLEPTKLFPLYTNYLFKSYLFIEEFFRNGKGIVMDLWSTRWNEMRYMKIPLPPLSEQQQIVSYLDTKTSLIDSLIEKTKLKIQLLKENRTSLINEVVTKGLNPNVEMKDSGVEWIGEIPKGWGLTKIKYEFIISGGGTPSKDNLDYWNGDIPWVSPKDMKSKFISKTEDYVTLEGIKNSSTKLIQDKSLLMVVRSGILQHSIPVCFNSVPVSINQDLKSFEEKKDMGINYLYYFIKGHEKNLLLEWSKDGTTVESIEMGFMLNSEIPLPPHSEQLQIVSYLDEHTQLIDKTISVEERRIELLKEYRQSLISEVVTGKRKVLN